MLRQLLGQAGLGDAQSRHVHKFLQPNRSPALSADTGLLDATKWGARTAARVTIHTAYASLEFCRKLGALFQVVCP